MALRKTINFNLKNQFNKKFTIKFVNSLDNVVENNLDCSLINNNLLMEVEIRNELIEDNYYSLENDDERTMSKFFF